MKLKPFHRSMVMIGVLLMKMKKSIALRLVTVWINLNGPSVCRYSGGKKFSMIFAVRLMQVKPFKYGLLSTQMIKKLLDWSL